MRKLIYFFLLVPAITTAILVVHRVATTSENHISFDPYLFMVSVPFSGVAAILQKGTLRKFAMAIATLITLLIPFCTQLNILLSYEEWVLKGMPDRGWTQSR